MAHGSPAEGRWGVELAPRRAVGAGGAASRVCWCSDTNGWMRVLVSGGGRRASCAWLALAFALSACGNTQRNGARPSNAGGTAGAGTSSAGTGGEAGAAPAFEAVPSDMRRLNAAEYQATVSDTLGSEATPDLTANDASLGGFDNAAAVLHMTEEFFARYLNAAELVSTDVFASAPLKARVVICQAQDDTPCVRSVIASTGLRLFRRPLLDQELPIYEKVYAAARARGEQHEAALHDVLTALLVSAQFLYRSEFQPNRPGTQALGAYDIASRLSYLLWSSAPDDTLLGLAATNALGQDEQLETQLTRMWHDPKSKRFATNFAGQWLGGRQVLTHAVDPQLFPAWTPAVAAAAAAETYDYFDGFVRGDRDWSSFLSGHAHQIDGALTSLYGLDSAGAGQSITLDAAERTGYLGSVTFLAMTSLPNRSSPVRRGHFILQNLLCQPLEPPPPNVPKLELGEKRTPREYFVQVEEQPVCGTCHKLVDPIGMALENYDGIGQYRATYADGTPIDATLKLAPSALVPKGVDGNGLSAVIDRVTQDPSFKTCLAQNVYAYATGRAPADVDRRNIAALSEAWQTGPLTIEELVRRLVLAAPFRFRSEEQNP